MPLVTDVFVLSRLSSGSESSLLFDLFTEVEAFLKRAYTAANFLGYSASVCDTDLHLRKQTC